MKLSRCKINPPKKPIETCPLQGVQFWNGFTNSTYRVKSVFALTDKNGKTEAITVYSNEKSI